LDFAIKNQGLIFRLQALDSTEEAHTNTSELLLLLSNQFTNKITFELTLDGKVLLFEAASFKTVVGNIDKYFFSNKLLLKQSYSQPEKAYVSELAAFHKNID
jgi:hypothetical protein